MKPCPPRFGEGLSHARQLNESVRERSERGQACGLERVDCKERTIAARLTPSEPYPKMRLKKLFFGDFPLTAAPKL